MSLLDGHFLCNMKSTLTAFICSQDLRIYKLSKFLWNSTKSTVPTWMWSMNPLKIFLIYSGLNLRTFKLTDSPLTVLVDSPLKMLLQASRCIHCLTILYLDLLPAEWHQIALTLELVKGPGVTWRWSKMGRGPTWVVILLKSKQYCTHQPLGRRQGFAVRTSAAMILVISL